MEIKLKDTTCDYFSSSKKAIEYEKELFANFTAMPKLLDPDIDTEEFFRIVDIFYMVEIDRPTKEEEIKSFIKQELTEKRIRRDIFTIRNRLLRDIKFIRLWYIDKEISELEAKLAILNGYDNTLEENEKAINEISNSLKKNRRKRS